MKLAMNIQKAECRLENDYTLIEYLDGNVSATCALMQEIISPDPVFARNLITKN